MDADEVVLWRLRRCVRRTAWRKHVATQRKTWPLERTFEPKRGTMEGVKERPGTCVNRPGIGREMESPHDR